MGLPPSDIECGRAHIGGAESIRLDGRRQARRSAMPFGMGLRSTAWATMTARATPSKMLFGGVGHGLWKGAPIGAGMHHDRLG
jgi:hypothetical protein